MSRSNATGEDFDKERDRIHLEMMSAVSHDLKTPLASIIGSLEIHDKMAGVLTPEKKRALLNTAVEEAYRLDGFISNILDMARLDNRMIQMHKRDYDILSVMQDCVAKVKNRFPNAVVDIDKSFETVECHTDASLLNRALYCVIENAIKHGDKEPVVSLSCQVNSDVITINVKDNGAGISVDDYAKIFDKYTRIAKKDYKNAGTGLGLTISRAIMRLLGGELRIIPHEQAKPSGAWFALSLPVRT